jgi:hypothetical protein
LQSQADMGFSLTPVGAPIISAIDAVHAVKHHDALGAGVAGLGLIPLFGAARRAALAEKLARGVHKADVAAGPEQKVYEAMGSARVAAGERKQILKQERGAKFAYQAPEFEKAGGGEAGAKAAFRAMRGEHTKVPWHDLTTLTQHEYDSLPAVSAARSACPAARIQPSS